MDLYHTCLTLIKPAAIILMIIFAIWRTKIHEYSGYDPGGR